MTPQQLRDIQTIALAIEVAILGVMALLAARWWCERRNRRLELRKTQLEKEAWFWPAVIKGCIFAFVWRCILLWLFGDDLWHLAGIFLAVMLGWLTLLAWDSWRGRREDRALQVAKSEKASRMSARRE